MKEIVIKISDELYEAIIDPNKWLTPNRVNNLESAVLHGKVLSKGHGALKDVNSIPEEDKHITVKSILAPHSIACIGAITVEDYINGLPTVVEADNEMNEKEG